MDVGQRFSPSDEEIVNHFLKLKLLGNDYEVSQIPDLDIYQFDPWDLPRKYYSNGPINRSTITGSWQSSGWDKKVMSETGEEIGTRKIFVHSVIRDGVKWVMHEYSANFNLPNQRAFVLCKIKKKPYKKAKRADKKTRQLNKKAKGADKKTRQPNKKAKIPTSYEGEASRNLDSDFEGQSTHQETDLSTYKEDEKIDKKAKMANKKTRQPYKKAKIPTSYEGKTSRNVDSDFEQQSINEGTDRSIYKKGKSSCNIAFNLETRKSEKTIDISTYDKDEKVDNSTCDKGGTNHLMTPASENHVAEITMLDQVDSEILPYLESFPGFNLQDYSLNFALD